MSDITVDELHDRLSRQTDVPLMIDVREDWEYANGHITETHIPLGQLPEALERLDWQEKKDQEIVMICRSGNRSDKAVNYMSEQGFSGARNLVGGMLAWKANVEPEFNV